MKLAIHGGDPVRRRPFPGYNVIGAEEKDAACRVLDSGVLSRFLGCWHDDFHGGPEVQQLEREWAVRFGVRHAIAATSGLYAAVGGVGVEPGDEVIVSPYTMSASATAAIVYGALPVFADIEPDCFCLDPASVEARITSRTKAIVVVDIFGQAYDADAINAIARKHGIAVIEDNAQAPGGGLHGRCAGVLGDVGVFSLNYHKHIHCGEGGVVVTDNDDIAERVRLIRNHAEAVVEAKGVSDLSNMVGFNYRMTELEAAIARCQLRKLDGLVAQRQRNVAYLENALSAYPAFTMPKVRRGASHVYYQHAILFDEVVAGVGRDQFIAAVKAELPVFERRESEGVKLGCGYVKPLYLQPMYQQRVAFGRGGFPFSLRESGDPSYEKGICPVVERMHFSSLFTHEFMLPSMSADDMDDVVKAFDKVWQRRGTL